jgi:hypothetical protein
MKLCKQTAPMIDDDVDGTELTDPKAIVGTAPRYILVRAERNMSRRTCYAQTFVSAAMPTTIRRSMASFRRIPARLLTKSLSYVLLLLLLLIFV